MSGERLWFNSVQQVLWILEVFKQKLAENLLGMLFKITTR